MVLKLLQVKYVRTIESCWSRVPTDKLIMAVAIPK